MLAKKSSVVIHLIVIYSFIVLCMRISRRWYLHGLWCYLGFPSGSEGKESACNSGHPGSVPGWGRKWLPTPLFLPAEFRRQRSLAGCSPWGCKEFGRDWMMLLLANPSLHNCVVCNLWSAMCHIPLNHSTVFWLIKRSLSWKLRFLFGISIPRKCFLKTLWIHTSGRLSQVENKTKATFLASLFILILNVFGLHSYDK